MLVPLGEAVECTGGRGKKWIPAPRERSYPIIQPTGPLKTVKSDSLRHPGLKRGTDQKGGGGTGREGKPKWLDKKARREKGK